MPEPPRDLASKPNEAPLTWYDVLVAELTLLNPVFAAPPAPRPDEDETTRLAALNALNRAAFNEDRAALCLSGGGIRSASFAIGVLQAIAHHGLLQRFDYLSTVSGGGFAGGWLSAWLHRAGAAPVDRADPDSIREQALAREALDAFTGETPATSEGEPWPLKRIRLYTRYLSPQTGLFSADLWDLIATMFRNLLLNWAVLLPLLAAAMLVPRVQYALIHLLEQAPYSATWFARQDVWALAVAVTAYIVAISYAVRDLPSYGDRRGSQPQFLVWSLLPLSLGTVALTYYWAMWAQIEFVRWHYVAGGAGIHLLVWAGTGAVTGTRFVRPRTWIAASITGAVAALMFFGVFEGLFNYDNLSKVYVSLAFPLVMFMLVVESVLFVGLAGHEMTAADLEWWSRAVAWMLIVALGWLMACGVGFGVPALFGWLIAKFPGAVRSLGGITAVLGGLTSWLLRPAGEPAAPSPLRRVALALAAPAFVVLIVGAAATADELLVRRMAAAGDQSHFVAPFQTWPICEPQQEAEYAWYGCHPADGGFGETVLLGLALLGIGFVTSRMVPANKFSLHDMYLHRLARAYLGASRDVRRPNPFTGFDADDDVAMSALTDQRPLHIVNTTLNRRVDPRLGRLERRAASFTFSPLHSGSSALGSYRPSAEFAFNPLRNDGITLGMAITISGAAASPQMGEYTTTSLAFLLALFNARLGVWLGNPGPSGARTWRARDPRAVVAPIVREMLGWTTDANPYVFLSDGGHFDNLGLWEILKRRCRRIVVVDASCDPEYRMADLANAVRLARIDHGVEIAFDTEAMNALRRSPNKPHAVAGTITYPEAGADQPGSIVYIKPALSGDESVDVATYRTGQATFPHQSTANQFFSEAQFESYRALGVHSVEAALQDGSSHGLAALAERVVALRSASAAGADGSFASGV